jgi:dihydrofolate reductase
VVVAPTLADAIAAASRVGSNEIMIIGGGEIYSQALPLADRVYFTELAADIDGDTVFARLDSSRWQVVSRAPLATGPKDDYAAEVIVYERRH